MKCSVDDSDGLSAGKGDGDKKIDKHFSDSSKDLILVRTMLKVYQYHGEMIPRNVGLELGAILPPIMSWLCR